MFMCPAHVQWRRQTQQVDRAQLGSILIMGPYIYIVLAFLMAGHTSTAGKACVQLGPAVHMLLLMCSI